MTKRHNADGAAKQVTEAGQPGSDFRVREPHDPRQTPPVKRPMPAPLKKALGID
jgi:hypothetical protein